MSQHVVLDARKWPDRPHYRFTTHRLGDDQHGTWLACLPPTPYLGPRGDGVWQHAFLRLVATGEWWMAEFNPPADALTPGGAPPHDFDVYVDVSTPARWSGDVVTAVDLDLDVIRWRDGRVELADEDEFAIHQVAYGYPRHIVDEAVRTAKQLLDDVAACREPFGHASRAWFSTLDRMVGRG